MMIPADLKMIFYLAAILVICLTPVFLFKKRWDQTTIIAAVLIYFFFINRTFIWGQLDVWHDGMADKYFMGVLKQWLDNGIAVGWNPYMNAGEPLYLILNCFLFAPWILFCIADKFINVGPHCLYHLFWIFIYLNFCTGAFLLFSALYEDFRVALFCFITLILSGQFKTFLGQPGHLFVLYYLPFILFGFVSSVKHKNVFGAMFSFVFFGLASNLYIPHYLFLAAGIFVFSVLALHFKKLSPMQDLLKENYKMLLIAAVLFFIAAAPTLFLYSESKAYHAVEIEKDFRAKPGEFLNADLSGYRNVLLGGRAENDRLWNHVAFYIGIVPLLLLLVAASRRRDKYMWAALLSGIFVALLGKGFGFIGFTALVRYVPTFYLIRHSWLFSQFTCFYLILLSGYGLKSILEEEAPVSSGLKFIFMIIAAFLAVLLISRDKNIALTAASGTLILIFWVAAKAFMPRQAGKAAIGMAYLILVLVVFADLGLYHKSYFKTNLPYGQPAHLDNIKYPLTRNLYTPVAWPAIPDFSSVVYKVASVMPHSEDYVFFRDKRFAEMLKQFPKYQDCGGAFGIGGRIFYFAPFAQIAPGNTAPDEFIGKVFEGFRQSSASNRKVFFLENDIRFLQKNHGRLPQDVDFRDKPQQGEQPEDAYTIEYTKMDNPNRVEMTVDCRYNGFLVRLENFHRYWKASLDGLPVRIYRANYAFQAISVPHGRHKIVMKFESPYPALFWSRVILCVMVWVLFNIYIFRLESTKSVFAGPAAEQKRLA